MEPLSFGMEDMQGRHNAAPEASKERVERGKTYKDTSMIVVVPTRGVIPAKVVMAWRNLIMPMNGRAYWHFEVGKEVGHAYNDAISGILAHPDLSKWRYVLTLEEDNLPPPDGVLRLLENICDCEEPCNDHFSQVAGLYWTKGDEGQPMIYGNPRGMLTFEPQVPRPEEVQECNGTGMGFTLYHLGVFRAMEPPYFKTLQDYDPNTGTVLGTQDLYQMKKARELGFRIASDNRVRVGHLDTQSGVVW